MVVMAVKQFNPVLLSLSVSANRWRFSENSANDGGRIGFEYDGLRLVGFKVSWNIAAARGARSTDGPGVFSKLMATRTT